MRIVRLVAGTTLALALASAASAQTGTPRDTMRAMPMAGAPDTTKPMSMSMSMSDPIGVPMTRTGSGTTWLPDRSPMHAKHFIAGGWELMLHGLAFVQYDKQYTRRGDSQFGAPNWGMLMAIHPLGAGRLTLRGMMSLDPFTVSSRGYPLLLQSGEAYQGQPLHDRQHPHDLFMELAAVYEHPLANNLGLQLYLAPVGEPASGPVAFPHRPSASSDPLAPLGHHWQDATHISFGVATAALYTRTLKLEGSIFNGREPDEIRTNFDYKGRSLDSYAGRLTFNPSADVSVSGSYAYLKSPEALHPEISLHRVTASMLYGRTFGTKGEWSSALIYGANKESGGREGGGSALSNSMLAETNLDLDGTNTIFGRAEFVQKSAADLAVDAAEQPGILAFAATTPDTRFNVGSLVLGYVREIGRFTGGSIGLGARGSIDVIPSTLEPAYGTRTPGGFTVFVRFRPNRMEVRSHSGTNAEMGTHQGTHQGTRQGTHQDAHEGGHGAAGAPPMSSMSGMHGMASDSTRAEPDTAMRMNATRRDSSMRSMMELHQRMMADSVIRRRVLADTTMRRMMTNMVDEMPAECQAMMRQMMQGSMAPTAPAVSNAKKSPQSEKAPSHSTRKSTDDDTMPGMKMPPQR